MSALEGIKVLDMSRLAPGPFCTMLLSDFGAEVLLVEAPPHLVSRRPPGEPAERDAEAEAAAARVLRHDALRRNKRSIVLNLREDAGRQIFYRLCEDADVVLEGFRPGVVERLGVDYETLSRINPGIVYCSLSGYGQDGPYRMMVGHDINYISVAGALGAIGRPGQKPAIPLNILADYAGGGTMAAFSVAAALMARERSGRGQYIDLALSDGVLYLLAAAVSRMLAGGEPPRPGASTYSGANPHYDVYETADGGYISLGTQEAHFWENLCEVVGREDFKSLQHDTNRHPEIRAHLEATFRQRTRDEWFEQLKETDLCISPVYALDEAIEDPHNRHRGMLSSVAGPGGEQVAQIGVGPKLSETPGRPKTVGPSAGEQTDEVLASLGYGAERIEELRTAGIVG